MRFLVRLYPAAWRERYRDEFLAVLQERSLSPFDIFDIVLGAFDAHVHSGSLAIDLAPRRKQLMNARIGGAGAIVGGGLLLILMGLGFLLRVPQEVAFVAYPIAVVSLLVALVGLSAVQGRRNPALVWAAVAVPVAGLVLGLLGMIGMTALNDRPLLWADSGWSLWMFGNLAVVVGSALFATATLIVGVFSRGAGVTILVGSIVLLLIALPVLAGLVGDTSASLLTPFAIGGGVLFCLGWIWLGAVAVGTWWAPRLDPTT
jgi:hypothetical protein